MTIVLTSSGGDAACPALAPPIRADADYCTRWVKGPGMAKMHRPPALTITGSPALISIKPSSDHQPA